MIKKRSKILLIILLAVILYGCGKQKPNVIIIYTDDQNFSQIAAYGGNVLTPNIDRIAQEGVRFNKFYVSSPVCTPSRYSLLTGRYASRSKYLLAHQDTLQPAFIRWNTFLSKGDKNLVHLFNDEGYTTGMVGKYHLGGEFGYLGGNEDYNNPKVKDTIKTIYKKWVQNVKDVAGFDYVESLYGNNLHIIGLPKNMQYHNMEWVTKGAIDFIDLNRNKPFLLYFAPTIPHVPAPVESMKADPRITAAGMLDEPINGVQPSRESVFERVKKANKPFESAAVTWLDDAIGALITRLEKYDLLENTIIVFASDHQSPKAKMTCYNAAANAPALIMWKGKIQTGQVNNNLVSNVDIAPTLFDLCNINVPDEYVTDGLSWENMLLRGEDLPRKSLYLEVLYTRAIVSNNWEYLAIRFPDSIMQKITPENRNMFSMEGKSEPDRYGNDKLFPAYFDDDQLYNLDIDPSEQNNLIDNPKFNSKAVEMKRLLETYSHTISYDFGEFND